jgi:predicted nucleic acid-binding protein
LRQVNELEPEFPYDNRRPTVYGMADAAAPLSDRDPRAAVDAMLTAMHGHAAAAPLKVPSADGVFPAAAIVQPRPLVGDTRFLGADVGYACRQGQRTTLITATNAQVFRLFCAQHVVDEVVEHHGLWSEHERTTVTSAQFLQRWHHEYRRMIRVVPDDSIPLEWFSPGERDRLAQLEIDDADDIPSVKLALATRGLYLSKDHDALRAAYGAAADLIDHEEWLTRLKAGSDAAELMRMLRGAGTLTYAAGHGAFSGAQWIHDRLGDVSILLGAGAALLIWQWLRQPSRASLREGATKMIELVVTIGLEQREREEHYLRALPRVPTWADLFETNDRDAVVGRACLYYLAYDSYGHMSTAELAARIRAQVPCSDGGVRALLRATPCFTEVYRGRWQVGRAAAGPAVIALPARGARLLNAPRE